VAVTDEGAKLADVANVNGVPAVPLAVPALVNAGRTVLGSTMRRRNSGLPSSSVPDAVRSSAEMNRVTGPEPPEKPSVPLVSTLGVPEMTPVNELYVNVPNSKPSCSIGVAVSTSCTR